MAAAGSGVEAQTLSRVKARLAVLAKSQQPPAEFFGGFLPLVIEATSAVAGAAWGLNPQGLLACLAERDLEQVGLTRTSVSARRHIQLLLKVLHRGQGELRPAAEGSAAELFAGHHVLLTPLAHRQHCVGVLQLFLPPSLTAPQAAAQLETLTELSSYATRYLESQAPRAAESADESFYQQLANLLLKLHQRPQFKHATLAAVNEGRLLLGCDRVSLAVRRGKRLVVSAISGQDRVAHRGNLVRAMGELLGHVAAADRPLTYGGELDGLPAHVEQSLVAYLNESQTRQLAALPLKVPAPEEGEKKAAAEPVFGALLVEQFTADRPPVSTRKLAILTQHTELAVYNALCKERRLPLGRPWQPAQETSGKQRAIYVAASLLLLAAAGLLAFLHVPYRVEASGTLMPAVQFRVFSPTDGEVAALYVQGGERVTRGQPLLLLRDDALATELLLARNRLQEKLQQLATLTAESDEIARSQSPEVSIRLRGRISQTEIELAGIRERIRMLQHEQTKLQVKSQSAGTVATIEPRQQLLNRPVRRGELLLEVIKEDGPWQLELEVPGRRMGAVLAAQQSRRSPDLPVRYVTTTMPQRTLYGRVKRVATRTTTAADGAAIVEVDVAVDPAQLPQKAAGAEVFARITCGKRCLADVLFGDLFDFVRRRVW